MERRHRRPWPQRPALPADRSGPGDPALLQKPLGKWGKKLLARKGSLNLAVAAVARKLTVAIWYLMMGRWTTAGGNR